MDPLIQKNLSRLTPKEASPKSLYAVAAFLIIHGTYFAFFVLVGFFKRDDAPDRTVALAFSLLSLFIYTSEIFAGFACLKQRVIGWKLTLFTCSFQLGIFIQSVFSIIMANTYIQSTNPSRALIPLFNFTGTSFAFIYAFITLLMFSQKFTTLFKISPKTRIFWAILASFFIIANSTFIFWFVTPL